MASRIRNCLLLGDCSLYCTRTFMTYFIRILHQSLISLKPSAQSDREKEEGLPVAPFMDRDKVTKSSAQIGFIKFVLIPMFQTLAKVSVISQTCVLSISLLHSPLTDIFIVVSTKPHSQVRF